MHSIDDAGATSLLQAARQQGDAAGLATWREGQAIARHWVPDLPGEPGFLAYSVTKTCIATLAMQLVQRGHLDLDAPVAPVLPQLGWQSDATARQLLQHTAGVPDYGGLRAYHEAVKAKPGQPWSIEDFARETLRRPPLFAPGQGWAYSNPGYMVLRLLVEQLLGKPLAAAFRHGIAEPLGLKATRVVSCIEDLAALAPGPSRALGDGDEPVDARSAYHPGWVSHGVVAGPPSELLRFLVALLSGQLIEARSLSQMLSPVSVPGAPPPWRQPRYGLGLMAADGPSGTLLVGHGGGGPGYTAALFALLDEGRPVAAACALCAGESVQAQPMALAALGA